MAKDIDPHTLALTDRGGQFLDQFERSDRELAEEIVSALTLVSHSEFERGLARLIVRTAQDVTGPVALYATREMDPAQSYWNQATSRVGEVDAVPSGSDLGSEARVAALIRGLVRESPDKYLNHPTLDEVRQAKGRGIFVIDDFIGSGERTEEFLASMWNEKGLRSWHSLGWIAFHALSYSGTARGFDRVRKSKCGPSVDFQRGCPTYAEMPWPRDHRRRAASLFQKYGARTSAPDCAMGYMGTMAALVFEHSCPDNVPSIFWASGDQMAWIPLFPERSVSLAEASIFPAEIARRDPRISLASLGQKRLAASGALSRRGPIGEIVLVLLAAVARGVRQRSALGYITGLSLDDCRRVLDRCIKWGFLTKTYRITAAGSAELNYARRLSAAHERVSPRGEDGYHPKQLRGSRGG